MISMDFDCCESLIRVTLIKKSSPLIVHFFNITVVQTMMTNFSGCWNSTWVGLTYSAPLGWAGSLLVTAFYPFALASFLSSSFFWTLSMNFCLQFDLRMCSTLTCNLLRTCLNLFIIIWYLFPTCFFKAIPTERGLTLKTLAVLPWYKWKGIPLCWAPSTIISTKSPLIYFD